LQVRRESTELADMFVGHIGAMDTFARGLKAAERITKEGHLAQWVKQRYASYDGGMGAKIEAGGTSFKELEAHVLKAGEPKQVSGKQEAYEMLFNRYV
jgi:xylose isomerase